MNNPIDYWYKKYLKEKEKNESMIDKEHILLEIERIVNRRLNLLQGEYFDLEEETKGMTNELVDILCSIEPTIEALRTEYEKGRADVIADTISWLANVWPKYCSNQTIIEGYKEAIKD